MMSISSAPTVRTLPHRQLLASKPARHGRIGCGFKVTATSSQMISRRAELVGLGASGLLLCTGSAQAAEAAYSFNVEQYEKDTALSKFENKVTVILNIASA
ncbi:hypothetical protein WJX73_008938 [Symbiochloris irregularis]|uniref:Glutathione peroxidase n=1 Tax=Symbiochloris irregularis TaxID=706552 RepID=A0AAW1PRW2_9CHLO